MIEMINNNIYNVNFLSGLEIDSSTRSNNPLPGLEAVPGSGEEANSDIVEITGRNKPESTGDNKIPQIAKDGRENTKEADTNNNTQNDNIIPLNRFRLDMVAYIQTHLLIVLAVGS